MMIKTKELWNCFRWVVEIDESFRIIDGDTVVGLARVLRRQYLLVYLRFRRINAPEITGQEKLEGLASKEALSELLAGRKKLYLEVYNLDSFGRRVAELYIEYDGEFLNINDWLVENGFAGYAPSRDLENPAGWMLEF